MLTPDSGLLGPGLESRRRLLYTGHFIAQPFIITIISSGYNLNNVKGM